MDYVSGVGLWVWLMVRVPLQVLFYFVCWFRLLLYLFGGWLAMCDAVGVFRLVCLVGGLGWVSVACDCWRVWVALLWLYCSVMIG